MFISKSEHKYAIIFAYYLQLIIIILKLQKLMTKHKLNAWLITKNY